MRNDVIRERVGDADAVRPWSAVDGIVNLVGENRTAQRRPCAIGVEGTPRAGLKFAPPLGEIAEKSPA